MRGGGHFPVRGSAGPALALTSTVKGPATDDAVTSETSPTTAHRTSRLPWATATRPAVAHATSPPSIQWSAAASAARSAAPAARCRTSTASPWASSTPNTAQTAPIMHTAQTVAEPRSEQASSTRAFRAPASGQRRTHAHLPAR
ncbi:hypothetical protein AAW14_32920 [Streptomyces hygroscopicus]|nr:hypothetical protein [Streptomyces hygroscopicus]